MTTAVAKPSKKTSATAFRDAEQLSSELAECKQELAQVHRFLEKIQTFSSVVGDAKRELKELQAKEAQLKIALREVQDDIRSAKELINSSNNGMISLIEPGPKEFMPLFDRMEKSDAKKHGTNSGKWREQPLSILKLSPAATDLLYEADILFIGQLQDRIIERPGDWFDFIEGLTFPVAAAIADKLNDFVKKGGDV